MLLFILRAIADTSKFYVLRVNSLRYVLRKFLASRVCCLQKHWLKRHQGGTKVSLGRVMGCGTRKGDGNKGGKCDNG